MSENEIDGYPRCSACGFTVIGIVREYEINAYNQAIDDALDMIHKFKTHRVAHIDRNELEALRKKVD